MVMISRFFSLASWISNVSSRFCAILMVKSEESAETEKLNRK